MLVRLFGGVPIPETFTNSLEGLEIPRKSIDEVYNYILEDLNYCENNLPIRGTDKYDVWRVSKGVVQTLLGEVYLTLASMENNDGYYKKCVEYCEKVIQSGVYSLVDNYSDLWYAFNINAKIMKNLSLNYNSQQRQNRLIGVIKCLDLPIVLLFQAMDICSIIVSALLFMHGRVMMKWIRVGKFL